MLSRPVSRSIDTSATTAPKLQHYAAAEGVRDAFLRSHGDAGRETARPRDESELHRVVRAELGVDLTEIDVPNGDFLGWHRDSVAGHRAVRMDFRLRADQAAAPAGGTVLSVFLLPMKDTAFSPSYLEELEKGHYCQACIQYEKDGTIYQISRLDDDELPADYDPARVRAMLDDPASAWPELDVDAEIARIYRARAEGSRPPDRP